MKQFTNAGINFYLDSKSAYLIRLIAIVLVFHSHTDFLGNPIGYGGQIGNGLFFILAARFFKGNFNSIIKVSILYLILNLFSYLLSFLSESIYPNFVGLWFINALIIYYLIDYFTKAFKFSSTLIIISLITMYLTSLIYNDFNNIERVFSHKLIFYSIFYLIGKKSKKVFSFNFIFYSGVLLYIPAGLNKLGSYSDVIQQISAISVVLFFGKIISLYAKSWLDKFSLYKPTKYLALLSLDIYFWQIFFIMHHKRLDFNFLEFLFSVLIFSIISNWLTKKTFKYLPI